MSPPKTHHKSDKDKDSASAKKSKRSPTLNVKLPSKDPWTPKSSRKRSPPPSDDDDDDDFHHITYRHKPTRSPIWNFFKKEAVKKGAKEREVRALCQVEDCGQSIARPQGTPQGMVCHIMSKHPDVSKQFLNQKAKLETEKKKQQQSQSSSWRVKFGESSKTSSRRLSVTPITQYYKSGGSASAPKKYNPNSPLQLRTNLEIMAYLAGANLSFSHVENRHFIRYSQSLDPKINIPRQIMFSRHICTLLFKNVEEAMEKKLAKDLANLMGVGFTSDMWTSRSNQGYLSLTIHYIDPDWVMQRFTMDCRMVVGRHDSEVVGRYLNSMIGAIKNLKDSTATIMVTDAEAKMKKAVKNADKISKHLLCVDHAINNALKYAMQIEEVGDLVKLVRALATGVKRSSVRNDLMRKKAADLEVPFIKIVQYSKIRWSSMCMTITSIVRNKAVLLSLKDDVFNTPSDFAALIPNKLQFQDLEDILWPLEQIKEVSKRLQADETPTLQHVIPDMAKIAMMSASRIKLFAEFKAATKAFIKKFQEEIKIRVPELGRNVDLYQIAHYLNPTQKAVYLRTRSHGHLFYECEQSIKLLLANLAPAAPPSIQMPEPACQDFEGFLREHHDLDLDPELAFGSVDQSQSQSQPSPVPSYVKEMNEWMASPLEKEDIDVLQYWKMKAKKLPLLAKVAQMVYAIPATSASSERVFSEAGLVTKPTRRLLNNERVQELVYIHDNYEKVLPYMKRMKLRIQEFTNGEGTST